jgi:chromosome segregation ATPase
MDLLDGATGHANHAPLSHGQTMAVGRYLHDLIRQLQGQVADLRKAMGESNEAVGELKKSSGGAQQALQNLNENLQNNNTITETLRNELGRTNSNVGKLQAGLSGTNDRVAGLLDAQKVNETTFRKLEGDLADQADKAHNLREAMEKRLERDIKNVRDGLSRTDLDVQHLQADAGVLKNGLNDQKEGLRLANIRIKDGSDRQNDMETLMKIIEKRIADNTGGLKSTRMNLEDLNTATLKLHEDHENTKSRVGDLGDGTKKTHAHIRQVHGKLEDVAQHLNNAQIKLDIQGNHGEDLKQKLDHALSNIATAHQGQDRANQSLRDLSERLAQVGATADAVRAGLKESNSLLLPNIHLDSHEARHASARHGSLLMTGPVGGIGGAARTKKSAR